MMNWRRLKRSFPLRSKTSKLEREGGGAFAPTRKKLQGSRKNMFLLHERKLGRRGREPS